MRWIKAHLESAPAYIQSKQSLTRAKGVCETASKALGAVVADRKYH
jgi:hypothetical protein